MARPVPVRHYKPVEQRRVLVSFTVLPQAVQTLTEQAEKAGLSRARYIETLILSQTEMSSNP